MLVISLFLFVAGLNINLNSDEIKRIKLFPNIKGLRTVRVYEKGDTVFLSIERSGFLIGYEKKCFPITREEASLIDEYIENPNPNNPLYLFRGVVVSKKEVEAYSTWRNRAGLPLFLYSTAFWALPPYVGVPASLILGYIGGRKLDFSLSVENFWERKVSKNKYDMIFSIYGRPLFPKRTEFFEGFRKEGSFNLEFGAELRAYSTGFISPGIRYYSFSHLLKDETLRGDVVGYTKLRGSMVETGNSFYFFRIGEAVRLCGFYTVGIGRGEKKSEVVWSPGVEKEDVKLYSYSLGLEVLSRVKLFRELWVLTGIDFFQLGRWTGENVLNYRREETYLTLYRLKAGVGYAF